jgi:cytochrome c oxidase subunit 2
LVNGVQGSAMQAFGNQLSELDLAAVVTYERNAWGNNMGDMVQAVDVLNYKKNQ